MDFSLNPLDWAKFYCERKDKRKKEEKDKENNILEKITTVHDKLESINENINRLNDNYIKLSTKVDTFDLESAVTKEEILEELSLIKKGLQKELFDTLFLQHRRYIRQGYCSPNDKGAYQETYDVYHSFGKNGRANIYKDEVLALPDELPDKEVKNV